MLENSLALVIGLFSLGLGVGMFTQPVFADTVTTPISTGLPLGMEYDPINNQMFVSNNFFNGGSVSVIDTTTNTIIETIPTGFWPGGIAYDSVNSRMYVSNSGGASVVSVINSNTNTLLTSISGFEGPTDVAYDPVNQRIYVTDFPARKVIVIDTVSNSISKTITTIDKPYAITYNPTNGNMYVSNNADNTVSIIDTSSNTIIDTIPVGTAPTWSAHHPANGNMYVPNNVDNTISIIDPSSNTVIDTIPAGVAPVSVMYDPVNDRMYVGNNPGTVSVIDASSNNIVDTISVGSNPRIIAYDSTNERAYVPNYGDNTISVIEIETSEHVLQTVPDQVIDVGDYNYQFGRYNGVSINDHQLFVTGTPTFHPSSAVISQYSLPPDPTPVWTKTWTSGKFWDISANNEGVYLAGDNDHISQIAKFSLDGSNGPATGGAQWVANPDFFPYGGFEQLIDVVATDTAVFATGYGQLCGSNVGNFVVVKYNLDGTGQMLRTDLDDGIGYCAPIVWSGGYGITEFDGDIYAVGIDRFVSASGAPAIWKINPTNLSVVDRTLDLTTVGALKAVTGFDDSLYVAGVEAGTSGDANILVQKYDIFGTLIWTTLYGEADSKHQEAYDIAATSDGIFVVGVNGVNTPTTLYDLITLQLDPDTGDIIDETFYGNGQLEYSYNAGIEPGSLYVVGNDNSDIVLLQYDTGDISPADSTAPTISIPVDVTLEAPADTTPANTGTATATDDTDPNPTVTFSDASTSGTGQTIQTITRTWTATDASTNSVSAEQIITVKDTIVPIIDSVSDITLEATTIDGANVSYTLPSASDTFDATPNVECTPSSGSLFDVGDTTVNCTATDSAGNQDFTSFQITITPLDTDNDGISDEVEATLSPTGDPEDITIQSVGSNIASISTQKIGEVVTLEGFSSGNNLLTSIDLPETSTAISNEINFNYFDWGSGYSTVRFSGIDAPVPPGKTITLKHPNPGPNSPNQSTLACIFDTPFGQAVVGPFLGCSILLTCPESPAIDSRTFGGFSDEPNTRTFTCQIIEIDAQKYVKITGLKHSAVSTGIDTTSPELTIPLDITTEATSTLTFVDIGTATVTDNVDISPVITNNSPESFPLGTTTVTWIATDFSGNSASADQLISVQDTTNPTTTAALVPFGTPDDDDEGKFIIQFSGTDSYDVSPVTTATLNGIPVNEEQPVKLEVDDDTESKFKESKAKQCEKAQEKADKKIAQGKPISDGLAWKLLVCEAGGELQLKGPSFELIAKTIDESGNESTATAEPEFAEGDDDSGSGSSSGSGSASGSGSGKGKGSGSGSGKGDGSGSVSASGSGSN